MMSVHKGERLAREVLSLGRQRGEVDGERTALATR